MTMNQPNELQTDKPTIRLRLTECSPISSRMGASATIDGRHIPHEIWAKAFAKSRSRPDDNGAILEFCRAVDEGIPDRMKKAGELYILDLKQRFESIGYSVEIVPPNPVIFGDKREFFKQLFKGCGGTVELRALPSKDRIFTRKLGEVVRFCTGHREDDLYVGVATRKKGASSGGKEDCCDLPALWVDVDRKDISDNELSKLLQDAPIKPSVVVFSGNGYHLYFLLKEPVKATDEVEQYLRGLARYFQGDAASAEIARILRIPETLNYKYDPPRAVGIVGANDARFNLEDFEIFVGSEDKGAGRKNEPGWEKPILEHGVKEGERNETVTRFAGKYVGMGKLSREEILLTLQGINSKFDPPLDQDEVEKTLDSVIKTHERNHAAKPNKESPENERLIGDRLREITPGLDFINGTAYVAAPRITISDGRLERIVELITSERERFPLGDKALIERGFYTDRNPNPRPRWSLKSIEAFLSGGTRPPSLMGLFARIREQYRLYIDFLDPRIYSLASVWVVGTYFHRLFSAYPYIHLNGDPQTGKTKTLELTGHLAFNGELTFHSTPAYIVRAINDNHCTCCVDEAERLRDSKDEDRQLVISMYNSGYKRGNMAGKAEPADRKGRWGTKHFESYSPKMFASIKDLNPVLKTRCIPLVMVESTDIEIKNRLIGLENPVFQSIRDELYRAMMAYHGEIREIYHGLEDREITGREWELWCPLLSIASTIDGEDGDGSRLELYEELRSLALTVVVDKRRQREEETSTPKLLQALYELLGEMEEGFYETSELAEALCRYDDEYFGWMVLEEDNRDKAKILKGRVGKFLKREVERLAIGKYTKHPKRGYLLNKKAIKERLSGLGLASL